MNKRRILLGLTGSVASILYQKLIEELSKIGDVTVIITERSKHFVSNDFLKGVKVFSDKDEWDWQFNDSKWRRNDPILHIDLRDAHDVFVIAPCSANTLAKLANGITDNLLTSVARAWDRDRPFIIAPAMNTHMWEHPITERHIETFRGFSENNWIIDPQSKMLACKTEGMGAMANVDDIVETVKKSLCWEFPLAYCSGIPMKGHPGAFLTVRKHHTHTGVDLYTTDRQSVYAVERGIVVGIEDFTGVAQQSPWWEDTKCILIEGASGVVCYGEVTPSEYLNVGCKVSKGDFIARVKRVLKEGKERPDIEGHSKSMLHIEVYKHGIHRAFEEVGDNKSDWNDLIDPTPYLLKSVGAPEIRLYGQR